MDDETRINAWLKMHETRPHLKELELGLLFHQQPGLSDSVAAYAQKAIRVAGNRYATLSVLEDHLWSILGTLWDQRLLTIRRDPEVSRLAKSAPVAKAASAIGRTQEELDSALETIKSLRAQITLYAAPKTGIDQIRSQTSAGGVVDRNEIIDFGNTPNSSSVGLGSSVRTDLVVATTARLDIVFESARLSLETVASFSLDDCCQPSFVYAQNTNKIEIRNQLREPRLNTASTEIESTVYRERLEPASSPYEERSFTYDTFSHITIRENELRINTLLTEVVERDELINELTQELERVRSPRGHQTSVGGLGSSRKSEKVDVSSFLFEEKLAEIEELRKKVAELGAENLTLRGENDNLIIHIDEERRNTSEKVLLNSSFCGASVSSPSGRNCSENIQDESISARIPSSDRKESFDTPCQTLDVVASLSCTLERGVHIPPVAERVDLLAMLEEERGCAEAAIRETEKTKISLGQLEKKLVMLQLQLKRSGVKEAHIKSALTRSGLTGFMRENRAGVFERLYKDAFDRVIRMQRIREKIHQAQWREFNARVSSNTAAGSENMFSLCETPHPDPPVSAATTVERHFYGGGWGYPAPATRLPLKNGVTLDVSRTRSLSVSEYLITTHLEPPRERLRIL